MTMLRPVLAGDLPAARVHETIAAHMLADGYELVLDLDASHGSTLVDARDGTEYLDLFTFFASSALGMNHPVADRRSSRAHELGAVAVNKPSNSDIYTVPMARFVDTFARVLGDPALPHLFFIDGGALAVENALKVAFDWKSRWNEAHGIDPALGTKVLHLREGLPRPQRLHDEPHQHRPEQGRPLPEVRLAAHPVAVDQRQPPTSRRPSAPRSPPPARRSRRTRTTSPASSPSRSRARAATTTSGPQFLQAMQALCREFDALFVMDEVQTGVGMTGTAWAYQQLGVQPDVVAFGKKAQVCGVMAGGRVDEVPDNVFAVSSRINSTWGGNLTDMVRARRILEVIESESLIERAGVARRAPAARARPAWPQRHDAVTEVRGRGLMCAFTLPSAAAARRGRAAGCAATSTCSCSAAATPRLRVRPALTVSVDELDRGIAAIDRVLTALA